MSDTTASVVAGTAQGQGLANGLPLPEVESAAPEFRGVGVPGSDDESYVFPAAEFAAGRAEQDANGVWRSKKR